MKITLNELRTLIGEIIKEETNKEENFKVKQIKGKGSEVKNNTHFAIHKPSNSIANMWDYSDKYPKEPVKPSDTSNKRAMTNYKNKLENYKQELREINSEFSSDKNWYFYDDIKDIFDDVKIKDFVIVKKNDLPKYGINSDLNDYKVLESCC